MTRGRPVVFATNSDGGGPGLPLRKTIGIRDLKRERRRLERSGQPVVAPPPDADRPKTRADCASGPRPCPWVSCRHHLYLDVGAGGSVKINHPGKEPDELAESCALDVADRGDLTLEQVGDVMNLTRERVRQIELAVAGTLRESELRPFRDYVGSDRSPPQFDDAGVSRVREPSTMPLVGYCAEEPAE